VLEHSVQRLGGHGSLRIEMANHLPAPDHIAEFHDPIVHIVRPVVGRRAGSVVAVRRSATCEQAIQPVSSRSCTPTRATDEGNRDA
jgi:hypothetical protein